ncbi:hypothetical protein [Janthinobacterium sp. PSPC3-1]|uniref:hypothetical protein n=1 Tax=Janthinobacterium sp. PSPC3-1 TaxID=2804653 RepID=UPI003CEDA32C
MIVLADNDIILKLAQCDLLDSLPELLGAPIESIFVSTTARYQLLPKNPDKLFSKCGNEETVLRLKNFLDLVKDIPVIENIELLGRVSGIQNIDAGEQQLFVACISNNASTLITGDRKALRAVISCKDTVPELHAGLIDKVVTFESALLLALDVFGFPVLKQKLLSCPKPDGVLKQVLRPDMAEDNLRECLVSFTREVSLFLTAKERLPHELRVE